MASLKAEKPVGTQLFGQAKKEPAGTKAAEGSSTKALLPLSQPPRGLLRSLRSLRKREKQENQQGSSSGLLEVCLME
ncbi:hypothetical protein Ancab_018595 [Ancistrocladus abbreviatus]